MSIPFHGVLAPNAKLRPQIVPSAPANATDPSARPGETLAASAPTRIRWARLLKRVFNIDLEHCPNCGGLVTIIAAILDHAVMAKILTHLGLPIPGTTALSRAPIRSVPRRLTHSPSATALNSRSPCIHAHRPSVRNHRLPKPFHSLENATSTQFVTHDSM